MQQSNSIRGAVLCFFGLIILTLTAGCGHHIASAVPPSIPPTNSPSAPVTAAASAAPAAFQPYTLLPSLPPAAPVAVPRHLVLHLTHVHNRVYLVDSDRHLYEAGRDPQGHIYPIYRDPATRVTYPLYYDPARDNLYRLARQENGHFYRNYVGQSTAQFYDTDRDYERSTSSDYDRPIVTDSYNTYNYNTYNHNTYNDVPTVSRPAYSRYYAGYRPPPAHQASHFNTNWLWAIPVIVGAYLLLQPHHHSPPRPVYNRPNQVIVTQITQITQAAPVGYQPFAARRPVYIHPVEYAPRLASLRPHVPVAAAVAAGAVIHTATPARPNMPPLRPMLKPQHPVLRPQHPMLRPHVQQARLSLSAASPHQRVPVIIHRSPVSETVARPVVHPFVPARPHVVAISQQARKLEQPQAERPRVGVSPPPHVVSRPRTVARPAAAAPTHRKETQLAAPAARPAAPVAQPVMHAAQREEHAAPHAHVTVQPRPMAQPKPIVRPHAARTANKTYTAVKKAAAPKRAEKPGGDAKPNRDFGHTSQAK